MTREEERIETGDQVEESRRRFLKTASRIAVYTPPAMLVMSQPTFAESGGNGDYQNLLLQRHDPQCTSPNGPVSINIVRRFCRIF